MKLAGYIGVIYNYLVYKSHRSIFIRKKIYIFFRNYLSPVLHKFHVNYPLSFVLRRKAYGAAQTPHTIYYSIHGTEHSCHQLIKLYLCQDSKTQYEAIAD